MCVAVPAEVIKLFENSAEIDSKGVKKIIDVSLVPEVKCGDFVIVHAGFAIQIIDRDEALKTLELFENYAE
ncbi:MAG: HypC/HybG/HupF family hydrogenase formation chaperone [Actinobacteria bacterium]|nr:HypC/HybG/HupF family hydrogenase formation chaperone [Actinomycetota bacterium]MCL6088495.1 HypC/HybG/HupF family hydrogenase formation chaperone [Actinomycetota bacterium]